MVQKSENCVQLSKTTGLDLIKKCRGVINNTDVRKTGVRREFHFLKMKFVNIPVYESPPHWWQYRQALLDHLLILERMLSYPDPIYLSLRAYQNLLLLSDSNRYANAIFILDY